MTRRVNTALWECTQCQSGTLTFDPRTPDQATHVNRRKSKRGFLKLLGVPVDVHAVDVKNLLETELLDHGRLLVWIPGTRRTEI